MWYAEILTVSANSVLMFSPFHSFVCFFSGLSLLVFFPVSVTCTSHIHSRNWTLHTAANPPDVIHFRLKNSSEFRAVENAINKNIEKYKARGLIIFVSNDCVSTVRWIRQWLFWIEKWMPFIISNGSKNTFKTNRIENRMFQIMNIWAKILGIDSCVFFLRVN